MTPASAGRPAPQIDRRSLDRRLVSGVVWTAAAKWGAQIVTSGALLVQARILAPEDFGIVSVAYLLLGFINIIAEFGIGSSIVVMRESSERQVGQMHAVAALLGVAGTLAAALAATPMAAFFRNPQLIAVIPVMGLGFMLSGLRTIPQAVLTRDLKFRRVSEIEASSLIFQAVLATVLAWFGLRYWSLIIASLAASILRTVFSWIAAPCRFVKPVGREVRAHLVYSQRILVSRAAWYFYSNADFMIAGRFLGASTLGVYTMAWNLANVPVDRVVALVLRVTPSVFSSVQHDSAELRRYLRVVTEGMAMLVFPAGFGIAMVADLAVPALFDKRWTGLAMPLSLLALAAIFNCLFSIANQILATIRDVRYAMWVSLASAVVYPASFWFGSRWGGSGIAAAWLFVAPVMGSFQLVRALHKIRMPIRDYLGGIRSAGTASALMIAAVLLARRALPGLPPLAGLIAHSALGAAVYGGTLFIFFRPRVTAFIGLALKRRVAAKAADSTGGA